LDEKDVKEIKDRLDVVNTNLAAVLHFFEEEYTKEEEEDQEDEEDLEDDEEDD